VIDENARSLRPDVWRVNPLEMPAGGIAGFFRKGSGKSKNSPNGGARDADATQFLHSDNTT
jgi:hypothetical protein